MTYAKAAKIIKNVWNGFQPWDTEECKFTEITGNSAFDIAMRMAYDVLMDREAGIIYKNTEETMTYKESYMICKTFDELWKKMSFDIKTALWLNKDRLPHIDKAFFETVDEKGWEQYLEEKAND